MQVQCGKYNYLSIYLSIYLYIYMRRWGSTSKTKRRQVDLCKCKVADANVQVKINFAKAPTTSKKKSNFLWGLQGSVDWCPRNATLSNEMPILKNWGKVAMWVWAGPTLSHEMRLDPRKLPKVQFCVAFQCFDRQNCGEITVRWLKKENGEIDMLLALAKPFSTKCS